MLGLSELRPLPYGDSIGNHSLLYQSIEMSYTSPRLQVTKFLRGNKNIECNSIIVGALL